MHFNKKFYSRDSGMIIAIGIIQPPDDLGIVHIGKFDRHDIVVVINELTADDILIFRSDNGLSRDLFRKFICV